ncbi:MAG: UDP-forming cellulose synthase catalytic subunit [Nitrosomonadales bacterium]|nr:UDP-forming cellulose synthase catalytic subunit [Nitrosomonadales bacterium]
MPATFNQYWQENRRWQLALPVLFAGALIYLTRYSSIFFDHPDQIALGWSSLACMFLMYKLKFTRQQPWRMIFIVLASFVALRYIMWRTFDTMIYNGAFDFFGMSLLLVAEIYACTLLFLGLFINIWPLERGAFALPDDTSSLPTVDILIPTYNEPDEIIRITATAAIQVEYPKDKVKVYLLDDGGTLAKRNHPEDGMSAWERHYRLRQMAEDLGIGYITRETNQQAKAGNVNHALRNTDGDVVLILDCDHVPTRDILKNTIGHFVSDENLFLVQTPHFFINSSPVEKNLDGVANPSGENDMFYRRMHPAMDFWNSSYFCGSAALLRRKFLMEVGGVCGTTITEDAETSYNLHSKGYNSVYVDRPMICGLSPESYDDYVIQRSRWAQGMTQMLLLDNPLLSKKLSIPQRLAYFNSCVFWLFGFARIMYFIAPAAFLILGINTYNASWLQVIAFSIPFLLSTFVVMDFLYGGTRQPFFSEIYECVQAMFLLPAVISVLLNPRKPSFKVTPKGNTNDSDFLSPLSAPFFVIIIINITALALSINRWFDDPIMRDVLLVTGVWCVYNLYLALISLGAFWERKQIRKFHRIHATGPVTVNFPRMNTSAVGKICDVSLTGIGFEIDLPFTPIEQEFATLEVKDSYGQGYKVECKIHHAFKRRGGYFCGSEFITSLTSYSSVVGFVFGDSQRWVDNWKRKTEAKGTFRMLLRFLAMGIKAIRVGSYSFLKQTMVRLWKFTAICLTTPIVRDTILAIGSWLAYRLYFSIVTLFELLERGRIRKFRRIDANGNATVYFPRLNATLQGQITDISLTGIGVMVTPPFTLKDREFIVISTKGEDGQDYRFECTLWRAIKRDGKFLFGTEFVMDVYAYPKIVKFVYGSNMKMLRYLLTPKQIFAT